MTICRNEPSSAPARVQAALMLAPHRAAHPTARASNQPGTVQPDARVAHAFNAFVVRADDHINHPNLREVFAHALQQGM